MAKSTQLNIKVKGVDQASGVSRRIGTTAKSIAVGIGAVTAAAGAAAYAVKAAWDSMTKVGDLAAKAGTGADEIQQFTSALGQLGIQGSSIEKVAQAFAFMQKNMGESGIEGFFKVLDNAKKGGGIKELSEAFGEFGLNLGPLLAGSSDALREVIELQFSTGNGAIEAATKASNAWTLFTDGFKSAWWDAMGDLAKGLDENVEGGVYAAAFKASAFVRFAIDTVIEAFKGLWNMVKMIAGAIAAPFIAVGKVLGALAASITEVLGGIWDSLTSLSTDPLSAAASRAGDILKEGFSDAFENSTALFEEGADGLGHAASNVVDAWDRMRVEMSGAVDKAKALEKAKNAASGRFDGSNFGATSSIGAARNNLILGGSYASVTAMRRQANEQAKIVHFTQETVEQLKITNAKLDFAAM